MLELFKKRKEASAEQDLLEIEKYSVAKDEIDQILQESENEIPDAVNQKYEYPWRF